MMEEKIKRMSSKQVTSAPEITVSELDRQAPVSFVSDGGEGHSGQYDGCEAMLGKKLSTLGAIALGYTSLPKSEWARRVL